MKTRYAPLKPMFFVKNRQKLGNLLKPNSLAIFHSNDEMNRNGNQFYPFRQNSDLYYLCGIDQEETILLLFPNCPNASLREVLFIKQTDERTQIWEGDKYSIEEARQISGIKNIKWVESFDSIIPEILSYAEIVYLNSHENTKVSLPYDTQDIRFAKEIQTKYPIHRLKRLAPLMAKLRTVKTAEEIELIRKALYITSKGINKSIRIVKPEINEFDIEAELISEFIRNRANGHSFKPIIASGKSTCILHYIHNNGVCKDGDLLLIDCGAEYANYAGDITRTVPVNGKFSARQREIYSAVYHIMLAVKNLFLCGTSIYQINIEAGLIIENELIKIGLLNKEDVANQNPDAPLYKKYFPHGITHFVGLDVHDVGSKFEPLKEGMVMSCEPGIYIPEEEIGVRLENVLLITNNGPIDLVEGLPLHPDDVENWMKENI